VKFDIITFMPSFIIFAWLASIAFGLANIFGKLITKYSIANAWLFNFFYCLMALVYTIPLAIFNNVTMPVNWSNIIYAGVATAIEFTLYIFALYKLDVSIIGPLFNFKIGFAVILAGLFLNEILTPFQYFLATIIFIAGIFVSIDEKMSLKSFFKLPVFLIIMSALGSALMAIFTKKAIADNGYWSTTLGVAIVIQGCLMVTIPLFIKDLIKINKSQLLFITGVGLVDTVGLLASNAAYAHNVSISSIIIAVPFSMIAAAVFSHFIPELLEHHTVKTYAIRFTATAVMILAALKLSL